MSSQAYAGTAQRTFAQAVQHLLQHAYGVLGSGRILQLLAQDLQALVEQFYPAPQRLSLGWMVFAGTLAQGPKAHPGQAASDHTIVTLAWPVLTPEDLQTLAQLPSTSRQTPAWRAWMRQRLVRLVQYGWQHPPGPVVLTLADLSVMLGLSTVQVSQLLAEARAGNQHLLWTKGYYFDQGRCPTHKALVIQLYEAGQDEAAIAYLSGHAPASVGRYLRDYERVKLAVQQGLPWERLSFALGLQPSVVAAYRALLCQYHPELFPEETSPPVT